MLKIRNTIGLLVFVLTMYNSAFGQIHFIEFNTLTKIYSDCHICENGQQDKRQYCSLCNHWSIEYRQKNTCSYCYNNGIKVGKTVCNLCNGSGQIVDEHRTIEESLTNLNDGLAFVYMKENFINNSTEENINGTTFKIVTATNSINNNYFSSKKTQLGSLYDVRTIETINSQGYNSRIKKIGKVEPNLFGISELTEILQFAYPGYRFANYSETEEYILNSEVIENYIYSDIIVKDKSENGYYPMVSRNGGDIGQLRYKIRNNGLESTWIVRGSEFENLNPYHSFKPPHVFEMVNSPSLFILINDPELNNRSNITINETNVDETNISAILAENNIAYFKDRISEMAWNAENVEGDVGIGMAEDGMPAYMRKYIKFSGINSQLKVTDMPMLDVANFILNNTSDQHTIEERFIEGYVALLKLQGKEVALIEYNPEVLILKKKNNTEGFKIYNLNTNNLYNSDFKCFENLESISNEARFEPILNKNYQSMFVCFTDSVNCDKNLIISKSQEIISQEGFVLIEGIYAKDFFREWYKTCRGGI